MEAPPLKEGNRWLVAGIVAAILTVLAPVVGLLGSVMSQKNDFGTLGQDGLSSGVGDLAGQIGETLVATVAGLIVSLLLGLPVAIICLVKHSRARKRLKEVQAAAGAVAARNAELGA
ncbi:MotA/TolQ/ExbB proton channel family protein [Luteolibacter sp. Populi]|uniref:MotA/TolQ/ExbB proton channel family protein n=1 Tax=Luteolibacter sp. Populi TaxID=3230487 RepID=UPI00346663CB